MQRSFIPLLPLAAFLITDALKSSCYPVETKFMGFSASCARNASNVEYRNCRAKKFAELISGIKGSSGALCDHERCIYKLKPDGVNRDRWVGAGYVLSFVGGAEAEAILRHSTAGWAVILKDPMQRVSVFQTCGTCTDLDHVRGPLKYVAVQFISPGVEVLAIANQ
jgi:hypothetical protein